MERGKKTNFILKQFKKKSKRILNKDFFTELFYLNKERNIIEFLKQNNTLIIDSFFKQFLSKEYRDFISIKILNDIEEEIRTWYYLEENLVLIIEVKNLDKKEEIFIELNIDLFKITKVGINGEVKQYIDYVLFNDYLISFLSTKAREISKVFDASRKNFEN